MKERLLKLNKLTNITCYLCIISSQKMITAHEGALFEADTPAWMQNFITGSASVLTFEQNGQKKQYFRWKVDEDQIIVILDEPTYANLTHILNKMLSAITDAPPAAQVPSVELELVNNKYHQIRAQLEAELKKQTQNSNAIEQMKDVIQSLKEQNADQASRLKDALSKNLDLAHQLKQTKTEQMQTNVSQARGTVTLLRDENSRLTAQSKQWEERYNKLLEQHKDLLKNNSAGGAETFTSDNVSKGLIHVVNALNKVIATSDASHIDLKKLSLFLPIPSQGELESNPNAVKAIIAKLLGMERSGQLTAFQIKKLNEIFL